MITIVYASRATRPMDTTDLTDLLDAARLRNGARAVTGMLVYAYESFMQQLEGDESALGDIFSSIERDPRHSEVRVLSRRSIAHRRYEGWAMGFEHPDAETLASRIPHYRPTVTHPLVNSTLVGDTEMAETLLELAATSGSVTGR